MTTPTIATNSSALSPVHLVHSRATLPDVFQADRECTKPRFRASSRFDIGYRLCKNYTLLMDLVLIVRNAGDYLKR